MDISLLKAKAEVLRRRPSRIVDLLREPRPIVRGGPFVNRMGLQVARVLVDHVGWLLRGALARSNASMKHDVDLLTSEGILVVQNFLSADDFNSVLREFEFSRTGEYLKQYRRTVLGNNFLAEGFYASDYPEHFPSLMMSFRDNRFLQELASATSRRSVTYRPHVELFHVYKPDPTAEHTDLDYNQFIHADRHFPFIKAFFYLVDVDEDTAPYTYVPRSHLLSLERIRYEYLSSLQTAKARVGTYRRTEQQLAQDRHIQRISADFLDRIRAIEKPIVAPANTLIVSNNQGFHRRGEMRGSRARSTVNMDFKYLESHAQWMYPVLKHLYR